MPKVIVREIDNTTAGSDTYSNFTVVIPGEISEALRPAWEKVADENGVYECSSIDDFETYIGKVNSIDAVTAEAPTVITFKAGETTYGEIKSLIAEDQGSFYSVVDNVLKQIGKLQDENYKYTVIEDILVDDFWQPDEETSKPTDASLNITDLYYIETGKEGTNAKAAIVGNRLAYILLSLGYTILYKKILNDQSKTISDWDWWEPLVDKANYDFRYISLGGYSDDTAIRNALKVAARYSEASLADWPSSGTIATESGQGRGDVTVLVDVDESNFGNNLTQSEAIKNIQSWIVSESDYFKTASGGKDLGKYGAICAPKARILVSSDNIYDGTNKGTTEIEIPCSIYYLACAAKASETYAEWYPVAGYVRGVSDFTVVGTTLPLGDLAVQSLQPRTTWATDTSVTRSVNVLTKIKTLNNQYYFWGSRTAHPLDNEGLVASHFLNIRQLCTTLKKDIYNACKKLTFSPNDDLLWTDFKDLVRPTLEKMKADRGIKDYDWKRVIVSKKALMKVKIQIVPIEPVEDFNIGVYLEDSINGMSVEVDDE